MSAASLGNPQSMNMYAYIENNPIDYTDPSGLFRIAPKEKPSEPDYSGLLSLIRGREELDRAMLQNVINETVDIVDTGGGGIHIPQEEEKNDCLTLVNEVNRLARETRNSRSKFMTALKERFIDKVDRNPHTRGSDQQYNEFASRRFKSQFKEEVGKPGGSWNQVYHYVGTFHAGFWARDVLGTTLGNLIGQIGTTNHEAGLTITPGIGAEPGFEMKSLSESDKADLRLNVFSVWHGAMVGSGEIKPSELGALIQRDICEKK